MIKFKKKRTVDEFESENFLNKIPKRRMKGKSKKIITKKKYFSKKRIKFRIFFLIIGLIFMILLVLFIIKIIYSDFYNINEEKTYLKTGTISFNKKHYLKKIYN